MIRTALACLCLATPAAADTLSFPANARLLAEEAEPLGLYAMPTGAWTDAGMPVLSGEGQVIRQAWQVDAPGLSSFEILRPLRDQLSAAGFELVFLCATDACGGFDFRLNAGVMPAPDMHVNLADFRYLAARRTDDEGRTELLSLLVSRSGGAGHVQVTRVGPAAADVPLAEATGDPMRAERTPQITGDLAQDLEANGHAVLADLSFETGSARLAQGDYASLRALADYLRANPDRVVALVGHTDSVGSLEGNIALSRRRAASVLERLVGDHGIPRRQLDAQGMGYLAPVASNLTEDGREANRRVEAILTSTD
ncbi:MAG: OmpA-OmpF porin, OOP family [Rhodobacteraceae bacterium HLUCCA08]|nr:MAG: OmpA-OmpF porin, OOP family [Rhodobacteraceae bacterium HLUCCA08]